MTFWVVRWCSFNAKGKNQKARTVKFGKPVAWTCGKDNSFVEVGRAEELFERLWSYGG